MAQTREEILKFLQKKRAKTAVKIVELQDALHSLDTMIASVQGRRISGVADVPPESTRFSNNRVLKDSIRAALEEAHGKMKRDELYHTLYAGGAFINRKRPRKNFELSLKKEVECGALRLQDDLVLLETTTAPEVS